MQLMKSKDGGFTYVYSQTDVGRLENYGWVKADPSEQLKRQKAVKPEDASIEPTEPAPKKRGRPAK